MAIIKLIDNAIVNIETDMNCYDEGCITCGYGSDYCTEIIIQFSDNSCIHAEYHESYHYSDTFSLGYFIGLFCRNVQNIESMTKDEFVNWFKMTVSNDFKRAKFY